MIKEIAAIILIALVLSGVGHALRPMFGSPEGTHTTGGDAMENNQGFATITLEDARLHFEKGTALFADARPLRAYSSGHIKGAINLDPNEFDAWSGDFFSRIAPDQVIVTYCEGAQCSLSSELAEKLTWMGYENVFYLKDGWGLWKKNQLPVEEHAEGFFSLF